MLTNNLKTLVFSQEFDYWMQWLIINFSTTTMALLEYFMLLFMFVLLCLSKIIFCLFLQGDVDMAEDWTTNFTDSFF